MVSLYARGAAVEDAPLVAPPVPGIHRDYNRPELKLLGELGARHDLVVALKAIGLLGGLSPALEWARVENRAHIAILVIGRDAVLLEVVIDVLGLPVGEAVRAAVDDLLLRQSHEVLFQVVRQLVLAITKHQLLVDLELHDCRGCEDVGDVVVEHVLHRRHELAPVIVIVVLKLCNLKIFFRFGQGGYSVIEFLKLGLTDVGKTPHLVIELLIQLLPFKQNAILREVKHKPIVVILVDAVALDVFDQIIFVDAWACFIEAVVGEGCDYGNAYQDKQDDQESKQVLFSCP